jgi:hypothetical protein
MAEEEIGEEARGLGNRGRVEGEKRHVGLERTKLGTVKKKLAMDADSPSYGDEAALLNPNLRKTWLLKP